MSSQPVPFSPDIRKRVLLAAAMLGLAALGAGFAGWAIRRVDLDLRAELLLQTQHIAQALPIDCLQALRGDRTDLDRPEYHRLKEQLRAAQQIGPDWEWIYLMNRQKNGTVFFQLDSEDYDVEDPTLPGQTYEEASPLLQQVFAARITAIEGPLPDRWGVWVSAFVPLTDPTTGQLLTVVGIDVDAATWRGRTYRAGLLPAAVTVLLLVILLVGARPRRNTGRRQSRPWRHREAALTCAVGLILTLAGVWIARLIEARHQQEIFRSLVQIKAERIREEFLRLHYSELEGLARFFESSQEVQVQEFRRYAKHLAQGPEVLAWCWIPAVPEEGRRAFEQEILATGWRDFRLWETGAGGQAQAAASRPMHYPVLFIEPADSRARTGLAPGYDLAGHESIRTVLESATASVMATATGLLPSLPGAATPASLILAVRPVFDTLGRRTIRGFVLAALAPQAFLSARSETPGEYGNVLMDLLLLRPHQPPAVLASHAPAGQAQTPPAALTGPWTLTAPLLAFNHTYAVMVRPAAEFLAQHSFHLDWILLLAGLLITLAAATMVGLIAHRREDMERLVTQRSTDLVESLNHFNLLARHNRIITWELDLDGCYRHISDMTETILGYRPDEIIDKLHFYDLCPAANREAFRREGLEQLRRGQPVSNVVNAMQAKSGQTVWVSSNGIPIRDAAGNLTGFWGTDTDITEHKRAEDELARLARENQQAVARYATLISASNTGAWEYHDDTARMWASPEYFAMLGLDPARILDANGYGDIESAWLDLLHPDDRAQARQDFIDYMQDPRGIYQHSFRMRHADGHWVWVLSRGRMVRDAAGQPTPMVVGTHIDITGTKRIEEALRESERKYRTLFEEMLEGFALHEIICDAGGQPSDYRFLAVNPAFERMTGQQARDLIGKTVLEALPGTERKWIDIYGQVALTGQPAFFDSYSEVLGKHFEVTAFRPAAGQFACIFTDITERKRAENELRESRRQHAALLANLPGMAYRCRNDRPWTMEFVSDGCFALTGYSPEDLVMNRQVTYNDIIAPAYRQLVWDKWQEALRERRPCALEYQIVTRLGEVKWVWEQGEGVYDEQGRLLGLEGFISDVTERKQADAERDRLTRAIEQSTETIVITDAKGVILYVNPEFTKATGYTREEALGQNPRLLQSGWHDAAFYREMWQTLQAGRTWEGQIINKRKDGSLFTEQATISPVRDAAGALIHFVAVKRDITEQIRIQKEKEDLQAQLLHSQKMESIGRLAGGVAHDFNNMLQAILGYTEMALELVPPGQPVHGDLVEIQKTAQRSAALTRQLQIFARKQSVMPRELNLNQSIEGMATMLRRLIGEEIQFIWRPTANLGLVKMDPGQVDQILANLCLNSRDAIRKAGQIVIETANEALDAEATRELGLDLPPGDYVSLAVHDDGCGMAPEVLEHIFEPFFTTKAAGKGTGLGLAIVYGIVKQNRGAIRVKSAPGNGTTFIIYLPRYEGDLDTVQALETEEQTAASHETILLVEDEETILQTTRRMLESLGYQVLSTPSPQEALRLAAENKGAIDLLITDVIMQDMNGPELVQALLQRMPDLKHLYMSGYAANLLAEQGVSSSRLDFIQKPFSRTMLAKAVREALRRK